MLLSGYSGWGPWQLQQVRAVLRVLPWLEAGGDMDNSGFTAGVRWSSIHTAEPPASCQFFSLPPAREVGWTPGSCRVAASGQFAALLFNSRVC
jgi:hypothetical protein